MSSLTLSEKSLIENDTDNLKSTSFISKMGLFGKSKKLNLNRELPDVQDGFRKGRGTRDQIASIAGSLKKQESSRKTSISAF